MKILALPFFLAAQARASAAFLSSELPRPSSSAAFLPTRPAITALAAGGDDFYADYNPDEWVQPSRSDRRGGGGDDYAPRGGGGGGGQGRGGGRGWGGGRGGGGGGRPTGPGGHDYVRDTESDSSNVDLETVDRLLSDRLQARKTGDFPSADAIRDQLLDTHGVTVWDKEGVWRTGASRSGSGMRRPGGGRGGERGKDRLQARKTGDFPSADAIRDQLLDSAT